MTLKSKKIVDEIYNRLDNDGSGDGLGLRMTNDPEDSSYIWNIGNTEIFKGIGKRQYPPQDYPSIFIIEVEPDRDSKDVRSRAGIYKSTSTFSVEVFDKFEQDTLYDYGKEIQERIIDAIELDLFFNMMDTNTGLLLNRPLVTDFSRTGKGCGEDVDGVVFVYVVYLFNYTEQAKGYRRF